MKVVELICDPLDIWVCRAELAEFEGRKLDVDVIERVKAKLGTDLPYHPSRNWRIGGRIIEREQIAIYWDVDEWVAMWRPSCWPAGELESNGPIMTGATALIAAMRCYVASKFGYEISVDMS
ncbi:phage protein NinX family protein [Burkholderia cepacia]|uniref:phage protein NinX family protein n=1 Tax=Burkholderia cepacia TaxID=292 RepID=UPI002FE424C8